MSRNTQPSTSKKSARAPRLKTPRTIDRRVLRTRNALGDALIDLMHETPFDAITVQHVLDRAGVSRSTFYTHYRDKNDLFLSDVEDFLELMAFSLSRGHEQSSRVAPVRELFSHVAEWREFHAVLVSGGKIRDFLDLAQGYFARSIAQRLSEFPKTRGLSSAKRAALAQMAAGSLLSLMTWWIARPNAPSPSDMDTLFHQTFWSGIPATAV